MGQSAVVGKLETAITPPGPELTAMLLPGAEPTIAPEVEGQAASDVDLSSITGQPPSSKDNLFHLKLMGNVSPSVLEDALWTTASSVLVSFKKR